MNLFIILFILIANVVAYLLIFHSFGKEMDNNKKIKSTLMIIGGMYIITLIIYFLSGLGVEKVNNSEILRNYLMMAFVPVNLIIIIPYSVYSFMKAKKGNLSKQLLNKRLLVVEIVAIVIFIIEFFYFRTSQKNMKRLADEAKNLINNQEVTQKQEQNTITNLEEEYDTVISNEEKHISNIEENLIRIGD